ncbi:TetR/AcrR family transcriptional regulator [Streptomyces coerulescens]|uniref:TetR/AcrR family transcriptional regulator n=1 Tax=Streptomyces coerulescens TaxID=29304 RepID=A0ABW0CNB3_STRCD
MARPSRYDRDQLLDTALRLAAATGPHGVTMAAVAKELGAPSGSVYHRFPSRSALLGALWVRTVESFQEGWFAALDDVDPHRAARGAAHHVVAWSRAHPHAAAVLLHGPDAFGQPDWPADDARRAAANRRRVRSAVAQLCEALGAQDRMAAERVALAVIDLPLTVVRRPLRAGEELPAHAEQLAQESAASLLAGL